jgi:hypothetical protein
MQGSFCAFLDASVLYPVSLRNLLMRLTIEDLYQDSVVSACARGVGEGGCA